MIEPTIMEVIDEVEAFQKTVNNAWNIPREEGLLLHAMLLLAGGRNMVEVGTSYGFSGLFLGSAARANGGVLDTYDIDPEKHRHASATFAKAGLSDVILLHTGDARELLARHPGPIDFAFIDADKPETMDYWKLIEPKLAPRCMVVIDNITSGASELRQLRDMLAGSDEWTYCDVDLGNGFGLAVRTG